MAEFSASSIQPDSVRLQEILFAVICWRFAGRWEVNKRILDFQGFFKMVEANFYLPSFAGDCGSGVLSEQTARSAIVAKLMKLAELWRSLAEFSAGKRKRDD